MDEESVRMSLARLVVYRQHVDNLADRIDDSGKANEPGYADVRDCLRGAAMLLSVAGIRMGEIFDAIEASR